MKADLRPTDAIDRLAYSSPYDCEDVAAVLKYVQDLERVKEDIGEYIRVYLDGSEWCAVYGDFVDLQNSPAGFGPTMIEAINSLLIVSGMSTTYKIVRPDDDQVC